MCYYTEMKNESLIRATALLASLMALAGCKEMCVAFCTDQTSIQHRYTDARDECRELAELRTGMASNANVSKDAKTQLVAQFSDCMGSKGWGVPGPGDDKDKKNATAGTVIPAAPVEAIAVSPIAPPPQRVQEATDTRAAECAFARQAADSSVIARKRAQACDAECAEMRRIAPEAPTPAACL